MTHLSPTALEEAAKAGAPELWKDHDNLTPTERALWEAGLTAKQFIAREKTAAAITAYLAQREKEGWVMVPARTVTDAKRYQWLRDGNACAPEEQDVSGGDELDALCDECLAAAQNGGE